MASGFVLPCEGRVRQDSMKENGTGPGCTFHGGVSALLGVRVRLFAPSLPLTPLRCALRGQPAAVQNRSGRFCLRRQDAGANIGQADGPKGEGRDAPNQPKWVLT